MKGLLLKDWYTLRKAVLLYAVCCIVFQAAPGGGVFLTVLYASMLPFNAFAYDDRSRWGELAAMMPYSVREIVQSRCIVGWAGILLFNLSGAAGRLLFSLVIPGYSEKLHANGVSALLGPSGFVMAVCASGLFVALMLPLHFRYDAEKSRLLRLLLIALAAGAAGAIFAAAGMENQTYSLAASSAGNEAVLAHAALIMFLCSSLATAVSIPLSMLAYRARRK